LSSIPTILKKLLLKNFHADTRLHQVNTKGLVHLGEHTSENMQGMHRNICLLWREREEFNLLIDSSLGMLGVASFRGMLGFLLVHHAECYRSA